MSLRVFVTTTAANEDVEVASSHMITGNVATRHVLMTINGERRSTVKLTPEQALELAEGLRAAAFDPRGT